MNVIEIKNLSKKYLLKHQKEKFFLFKDILNEEFYALKNVNLKIKKSECFGIIGENGSGKTTLLKIIGSITQPSSGEIITQGRVLSFLDIGAGFQEELTGRENIYLYGSLLGYSKPEINKKFNDILAFSDLEKFVDVKLKKYSTGMKVRLAFGVAMSHDPDVLLIDEIMAVGDEAFQKKSVNKIRSLLEKGKTIVFVSHDLNLIGNICNRVAYLRDGEVMKVGRPSLVIYEYLKNVAKSDYYDLEHFEKKVNELNNIIEERKSNKKKPEETLLKIIAELPIFQKEQQNKIEFLIEDILDQISHKKIMLYRDIDLIEQRFGVYKDDDYKNTLLTLFDNLIFIKKIELNLLRNNSKKVRVLTNINKLIDKKLIYTSRENDKQELYKFRAILLLKNIRLNTNPFDRSSIVTQLFGVFPRLKKISKNDPFYQEIKQTLKSLNIQNKYDNLSHLASILENIYLIWSLSNWITLGNFKENALFDKLSKFMIKDTIRNEQKKKIVSKFIFNELTDRLMKEEYDPQLRAKVVLLFYDVLKKFKSKLTKKQIEVFNRITIDILNHMVKKIVVLKQIHLYKSTSYALDETKELTKLKSTLIKMRKNLSKSLKGTFTQITEVWFSDLNGRKKEIFRTNDPFVINIKYNTKKKVKNPVFGIGLYSEEGFHVTGPNTKSQRFKIDEINKSGVVNYVIKKLPLLKGTYYVTVAIHPYNSLKHYDLYEYASFNVESSGTNDLGSVHLESEWNHIKE